MNIPNPLRANLPDTVPTHGDFTAYRDGGDKAYAEKYDVDYAERMKSKLYRGRFAALR